jgi:hypothetical protein
VTDRDTQLGYWLGYSRSEKADFELKLGQFGAEGGNRSLSLPANATPCLLNLRRAFRGPLPCQWMPGNASGLLHELLQKPGPTRANTAKTQGGRWRLMSIESCRMRTISIRSESAVRYRMMCRPLRPLRAT